jgi:hypothetical protein
VGVEYRHVLFRFKQLQFSTRMSHYGAENYIDSDFGRVVWYLQIFPRLLERTFQKGRHQGDGARSIILLENNGAYQ